MNTRKAVVGAAAILAAGLGGVATANTAAAQSPGSERITSIEQLKTSIQHAVAVEAQSTTALAENPYGIAGPEQQTSL